MTDTVVDESTDTTYGVLRIPDDPAVVLIQEHQAGRLRSVQWLSPAAAAELGRLLVAITLVDEFGETIDS